MVSVAAIRSREVDVIVRIRRVGLPPVRAAVAARRRAPTATRSSRSARKPHTRPSASSRCRAPGGIRIAPPAPTLPVLVVDLQAAAAEAGRSPRCKPGSDGASPAPARARPRRAGAPRCARARGSWIRPWSRAAVRLAQPRTSSATSSAVSVGVLPTRIPRASRASFLACAVPADPEMIAPACPIVLPGGAVKPAM